MYVVIGCPKKYILFKEPLALFNVSTLLQVIRDLISEIPHDHPQKTIIDFVVVKDPAIDLAPLARTESRVFLLYCTRKGPFINCMDQKGKAGKKGKILIPKALF